MKIAYITSRFPYGPGEAFLEAETTMLAQLCDELIVIPTRPKSRRSHYPGLSTRSVRLHAFGLTSLGLAVREACRQPGRAASLLFRLLGTRYRLRTKVKNLLLYPKALAVASVCRSQGIDHIHAHWLSTPSTVAYVAAQMTEIPWSCTAHRFDIFEDNLLEAKVASARFVRAISARNRDLIIERSNGIPRDRFAVVHLGVGLPQAVRPETSVETLRMLCAAALVPVKGHRYLIEALAGLRSRRIPFSCDLVGDGPLRARITDQIAAADLGAVVRVRGAIPHATLMAELNAGAYDLVVLASTEDGTEFEGIPVALIEAMAAGIPCVATATGSIPELIDDASCSTLVPQRDPDALAAAIAGFTDPVRRRESGLRARSCVERSFDVRATAGQLYRMMRAT